jgi:hypothetical protein
VFGSISVAYKIHMRFNDRELTKISLGDAELEGRLNHRRPPGGNFSQKGNRHFYFCMNKYSLYLVDINVEYSMF